MTDKYKYRVTNVSDEIQIFDDDGVNRRLKPGQSTRTTTKPDGRQNWHEIENLKPEAEDIENTADIEEEVSEESEDEEDEDSEEVEKK